MGTQDQLEELRRQAREMFGYKMHLVSNPTYAIPPRLPNLVLSGTRCLEWNVDSAR